RFLEVVRVLGSTLGPVLFQLPPHHQADAGLLRDFLQRLPEGLLPAFEFRHPSWFCDEILGVLGDGRAALGGGDVDDAERSPPFERTAPFGYLRLRKTEYAPGELESWAARITGLYGVENWFIYFKHEQS